MDRHFQGSMKMRKWLRWWILIATVLLAAFLSMVWCVDKIGPCGCQGDTAQIFVNETMKAAFFRFRIDNGRYPTTEEGLAALTKAPARLSNTWKGPYLLELPQDPWGYDYQYQFPGKHNPNRYDLWSTGEDGVTSDDDIGNWE